MISEKKIVKSAIHELEFLIIGLILLFSNVALYFISGLAVRYAALLMGVLFIFYAAFKRSKKNISKAYPIFVTTIVYFFILAFISIFQNHVISNDVTKQIFSLIALGCFFSGYLLATSKINFVGNFYSWKVRLITAITIFGLIGFLRYYEGISFYGTMRGYGELSGLNPVGIAFSFSSLFVIYFALIVFSSKIYDKLLYGTAMLFTGAIIITTASRGAIMWASLSIIFFVLSARIRSINWGKLFLIGIVGLVFATGASFLFGDNVILAESLGILMKRFEGMFGLVGTNTTAALDLSASARLEYWIHYTSNIPDWLLFGEKNYVGYPHNQFLEIMVRFGLFGIPLLGFSLYIFSKFLNLFLIKKSYKDLEITIICLVFLFSYLSSLSSLSLEVNRGLWLGLGYFWGYLAVNRRHIALK